MRLSYFPGCLLTGSGGECDLATRAVARVLGVELVELTDWNCCGGLTGGSVSADGFAALCRRDLGRMPEGVTELFCACPHCYGNFARALVHGEDAGAYEPVVLRNVLDVFADDEVLARLVEKRVEPLTGLEVLAYYGCKLTRPEPEVGRLAEAGRARRDSGADSGALERVVEACGAKPVEWSAGGDCCGAALGVARADVAVELMGRIFQAAIEVGAEAIVVACPLCHLNLDLHQHQVSQRLGRGVDIPVFFVTELMAVALGIEESEDWLERHLTSPLGMFMRFIEAQEEREYWGEEGPPPEGEDEAVAVEEAKENVGGRAANDKEPETV